jgi:hypothetical protein
VLEETLVSAKLNIFAAHSVSANEANYASMLENKERKGDYFVGSVLRNLASE